MMFEKDFNNFELIILNSSVQRSKEYLKYSVWIRIIILHDQNQTLNIYFFSAIFKVYTLFQIYNIA